MYDKMVWIFSKTIMLGRLQQSCDVIENTMEGNRPDRAKAVYTKYDYIFTGK